MRIQHNIPALNSHRNLGINNAATSKNLEKLSSGYRINRAGDDAAGLAISEKMRGQIRGLAMAEQNTSMGINLIQTAEGGLNETHAILQRMRELAVQSSNGTYQDSDRTQLTHEFDALMSEIDRISESTHYNGIKLLDGSLGANGQIPTLQGYTAGTGALIAGTTVGVDNSTAGTSTLTPGAALVAADNGAKITVKWVDNDGIEQTATLIQDSTVAAGTVVDGKTNVVAQTDYALAIKEIVGDAFTVSGNVFTASETGAGKAQLLSVTVEGAATTAAANGSHAIANVAGKDDTDSIDLTTADKFELDGKKFQFVTAGGKADSGFEAIFVTAVSAAGIAASNDAIVAQLQDKGYNVSGAAGVFSFGATKGKDLVFQIGANGGADQRVSLSVDDMSSKSIGLQDKNGNLTNSLASASIDSVANANAAIDIIDAATDMVSAQRAKLGALQNRLEHTMNNLGVTKENLTASESTIRDVDMASEMMEYTKNSILIQASQAMLAQANQLPQGVLQLLR